MVFDFQLGRGRDGPKKFLVGFNGILQTDGYAAYDKVGGPNLVHAACWSHSRRKFYEAHQVCPGESVSKGIVLLINDLFGIDAEGAWTESGFGGAGSVAPAARPAVAGDDPAADRSCAGAGSAGQQVGWRDRLHAGIMGTAQAVSWITRNWS